MIVAIISGLIARVTEPMVMIIAGTSEAISRSIGYLMCPGRDQIYDAIFDASSLI